MSTATNIESQVKSMASAGTLALQPKYTKTPMAAATMA
jgi:hypothetical protein